MASRASKALVIGSGQSRRAKKLCQEARSRATEQLRREVEAKKKRDQKNAN